jgi:hypothetical protein
VNNLITWEEANERAKAIIRELKLNEALSLLSKIDETHGMITCGASARTVSKRVFQDFNPVFTPKNRKFWREAIIRFKMIEKKGCRSNP